MLAAWPLCLERLEAELSAEDFHTWIKPLQALTQGEGLTLYAPNAFVVDTVRERYLGRFIELLRHYTGQPGLPVRLEVGTLARVEPPKSAAAPAAKPVATRATDEIPSNLDPNYSFETFVEGKQVVTVVLSNGKEYRGRVAAVADDALLLTGIAGREFFDALIDTDEIVAIEAQARQQ